MLSKNEIQLIRKLNQKKFRDIEQQFIAEGKRLVTEGLASKFVCSNLIISTEFEKKEKPFLDSIHADTYPLTVLSNIDFNKISTTKNSQGIAAVFEIPDKNKDQLSENIIVALENISDPGNVGTILRSCNWFGINNVILSSGCADIYNPKVLRASMGAVFKLEIVDNVDLIEKIEELKNKNYKTYYADMEGEDYKNIKYENKTIITFCNEAFGPSEELRIVCKNPITIPKKGNIDSLNVAAAAAVILANLN